MTAKTRSTAKRSRRSPARPSTARVTVENVNVPGYVTTVDAEMYGAMRSALLNALPPKAPGLTQEEMRRSVLRHLPQRLFPGGAKVGWWAKCVQLDLEAKGKIAREPTKPLRWHRKAGPARRSPR